MTFRPYKPPADYATTKDIVRRLVADAGGPKVAAFELDRRERAVYDYCDPDCDTQITLDQARRLIVASGSPVVAEALAADAGGVFIPGHLEAASFTELAARVCGEHGEFSSALCRALGDGVIGADERPELRRELDDLIRLAVAARARLDSDAANPSAPAPSPARVAQPQKRKRK